MRRSSFSVRVVELIVSAVLVTASSTSFAQYGASIQGTVVDKSGAIVSGATVTSTNQATGAIQSTVTSDSGLYRISALLPGLYTVEVTSGNFKKSFTKDVRVEAETIRGLNVTLETGMAQETVYVSGELPTVQSENASIYGGISARQVQELPQIGRDPYELLRLAPGVFGDASRTASGQAQLLPNGGGPGGSNNSIYQVENQTQISANGQRVSGNNFMIDGVDVNSLTWGGAAVLTPNQESISEIQVISTSYSADDGRNSGAQIKVVSKSGSNQWHGSAFFKYAEPGLNAYNRFNGFVKGFERAPTVRNSIKGRNYGGSLGGPLVKNKLFFFFSIEGEHDNSADLNVGYVETPEFRQALQTLRPGSVSANILAAPGAAPIVKQYFGGSCDDINQFSGNPGICAVIPAGATTQGGLDLGSPVPITDPADPYVPLSPPPGQVGGSYIGSGLDGVPDVVQALLVNPSHHYGTQYNGRLDYQRGKHLFAASTYITRADNLTVPNDQFRGMANVLNKPINPVATLLWNWTISPTLLNEARFNFSHYDYDEVSDNRHVSFGIPESQVEGIFNIGPRLDYGVRRGNNTPGILSQNTYAFRDTVSKVLGRFALKFGVEVRREQDNNNEIGLARPVYSSVRLWNFFNSAPIFEGVDWNPQTGLPDATQRYLRTNNYALFEQTDWKLRPNFTLNLGLRWEYFTPISEKQRRLTQLLLGAGDANPVIKVVEQLFPPDRNNFGPRVGFAWSPEKFNSKLVWRGGVGLFYNRFEGAAFGPMRENPPFHAAFGFCCGTSSQDFSTPFLGGVIVYQLGTSNSPLSFPVNPRLAVGIDPANNFPLTCQAIPNTNCGVQVYSTPSHMPNPYTYLYSLETEYQLARRTTVTLGYAGSLGRKELRIYNRNLVLDDFNLNQTLVRPNYFISPDVNSNFNSLNALFSKTFSRGIQFDAKYRWSKSLDQSSYGAPNAAANETYPRDLRTEYGPSDYDVTHSFVANGTWELPIFRARHDLLGRALGGWQVTGIFTAHSGFPWTPITNQACFNTPGQSFLCPTRPVAYTGGAGSDFSNDKFLMPNGNFPGGGKQFFNINNAGQAFVPGIGRNSFRGPRYQSVDMTFGKNTPFPFFLGEQATLQFRANFFNIFNKENLAPFGFNTPSTTVEGQYFGSAEPSNGGLSGRVIEFQARLSF